jgi:hypothetical protein
VSQDIERAQREADALATRMGVNFRFVVGERVMAKEQWDTIGPGQAGTIVARLGKPTGPEYLVNWDIEQLPLPAPEGLLARW